MRRIILFSFVVIALGVGASVASAGVCWRPPVTARVTDPFREPACRWCPGNRGLEYGTRPGDAVRAVAAGHVTFSGTVAGRSYVVIQHGHGLRATYGNLDDRAFGVGDAVAAGALIGHTAGAFHFGVRDGERYVDPAPLIGRVVGVVRLVPVDGSAAPPSGAPRLVCDAPPSVGFAESTR
jgi:murein DD-endopeptidase MepM/ murein hydrolase activator NlpD